MPKAERAKQKTRRPIEGILTPEQTEARMKALRNNEGRWVAGNELACEVLASAETYEEACPDRPTNPRSIGRWEVRGDRRIHRAPDENVAWGLPP